MRSSVAAVVAVATSVVLAACSNDTPTRIIGPSGRSSDVIPTTCSPNTIASDARTYFGASSKDAVFAAISALKGDFKNGVVNDNTTADVFSILARVAAVRYTSGAAGATADGATLVDDAIACATWAGSVPATFSASGALGSGMFAVTPITGHVEAFVGSSGGNPVVASPRWGAEAESPNGWPSGTYVAYGLPLSGTDATNGFELGTLPPGAINAASTATHPVDVGICASNTVVDPTGKPIAANLLVHDDTDILGFAPLSFCTTGASLNRSNSWFASLTGRLVSYFSPAPLTAQDAPPPADAFQSGGPSGWSPFRTKKFLASNDQLSFSTQPIDTKISGKETVVVHVNSLDGTQLPPLNVRLTIFGNNGTPSFLVYPVGGTVVDHIDVQTDASGNATFVFGFTKAGGYTLDATAYISGGVVGTATVVSALFQVQNK